MSERLFNSGLRSLIASEVTTMKEHEKYRLLFVDTSSNGTKDYAVSAVLSEVKLTTLMVTATVRTICSCFVEIVIVKRPRRTLFYSHLSIQDMKKFSQGGSSCDFG